MRPSRARTSALENQRAQGKPGARCTRSRAWWVESTRVSHHRFTGTPGLPCAMVLTAYSALSPVTGLDCHRRQRNFFHQLDASVGALGPHGFAVREISASSAQDVCAAPPASIASLPYVRDDRETPLCVGRDGERYAGELGQKGMGIFLRGGLDDPNQTDLVRQFAPGAQDGQTLREARKAPPWSKNPCRPRIPKVLINWSAPSLFEPRGVS